MMIFNSARVGSRHLRRCTVCPFSSLYTSTYCSQWLAAISTLLTDLTAPQLRGDHERRRDELGIVGAGVGLPVRDSGYAQRIFARRGRDPYVVHAGIGICAPNERSVRDVVRISIYVRWSAKTGANIFHLVFSPLSGRYRPFPALVPDWRPFRQPSRAEKIRFRSCRVLHWFKIQVQPQIQLLTSGARIECLSIQCSTASSFRSFPKSPRP